jgi:hypothetical protein
MAMIKRKIPRDLNLSKQDVERYILSHGWQQIEQPNHKLQVFECPLDNDEFHAERLRQQPIRLVLPLADNLSDTFLRICNALQKIADVEDRSIDTVVADINSMKSRLHTRDQIL